MSTYYKATRPDGTDFFTGTVLYTVGRTVTHPAKRVRDNPSTYLSVSTVPTDCTGFRWPCRLFRVEGHGRPLQADVSPNKRCFSSLTVVEELPAHQVFGPQGVEVAALIERCKTLTGDEAERLAATWTAARNETWTAARNAARNAAGDAARAAAWYAAGDAARAVAWDVAWYAAGDAARAVARYAASALLARDLITPEQFDILYGPWREVIG